MRPKYQHGPQGTHRIESALADDILDAKLDAADAADAALPNDPDIQGLVWAIEHRDDAEAARLLPLLKARYGMDWQPLGRLVLEATGRWPGRRKRRTPEQILRAEHPEYFAHPLVGKRVRAPQVTGPAVEAVVLWVLPARRTGSPSLDAVFGGELAILDAKDADGLTVGARVPRCEVLV
jgi:hypothetical protein